MEIGREEGAAALEFAIVGLILIIIVLGALEWGLWVAKYQALASAAREGARVAAVQEDANSSGAYDNGDVVYAIQQAASPYTVTGTPTASPDCTDNEGALVTVSWTQEMGIPAITPLPFHPPDTKPITGVFRCE